MRWTSGIVSSGRVDIMRLGKFSKSMRSMATAAKRLPAALWPQLVVARWARLTRQRVLPQGNRLVDTHYSGRLCCTHGFGEHVLPHSFRDPLYVSLGAIVRDPGCDLAIADCTRLCAFTRTGRLITTPPRQCSGMQQSCAHC